MTITILSQDEPPPGRSDQALANLPSSPSGPVPGAPLSTKAKSSTKKISTVVKETSLVTGLPYNTPQQKQRLDKCEWPDRLLYATRMLFGGNNVNGFLRGTATAQRIKKQRARQVALTKKSGPGTAADGIDSKEKVGGWDQAEEEKLKKGQSVLAEWDFVRLVVRPWSYCLLTYLRYLLLLGQM
jgi:hypothetical protein